MMVELEWKEISLADIDELRLALFKKNPEVSELSLANLFIWQEFDRPHLARYNSYLCLRLSPPNEPPYVLEPLGPPPPPPSLVRACLKEVGRFSRVPSSFLSYLPSDEVVIKENRDQFDYVYNREKMAELKGKNFDGKRNLIRHFQKAHPDYEFRPLSRETKKEAMSFFTSWVEKKGGKAASAPLSIQDQTRALTRAFELWEELSLFGGLLLSRKEVKGFIIASRLNQNTASVHFLYADIGASGASQTLLWEACRSLLAPFLLINLEQDMGLPGLRKAKLSYHPLCLVSKYDVEAASSI